MEFRYLLTWKVSWVSFVYFEPSVIAFLKIYVFNLNQFEKVYSLMHNLEYLFSLLMNTLEQYCKIIQFGDGRMAQ